MHGLRGGSETVKKREAQFEGNRDQDAVLVMKWSDRPMEKGRPSTLVQEGNRPIEGSCSYSYELYAYASIHANNLPGDERRGRTTQEGNNMGNVCHATKRCITQQRG